MAKDLSPLTDKEQIFIDTLLDTGGNISEAGRVSGYGVAYAYTVRKRLARHIAEAAQEYLAFHSVKAASGLVNEMVAEIPNPIRLQACQAILDRAGVIKKDYHEEERPTIKANIFILPEKREATITIEHE